MKRIKFINVEATEMFNFEDFLNQCAREGWVLDKTNQLYLTFRYEPDNTVYYFIIDNKTHQLFIDTDDEIKDQRLSDLASDMGYKVEHTLRTFSIFTKNSPEPMFSDNQFTKERVKPLFTYSVIKNVIQLVIFFALIFGIIFPLRFSYFTTNYFLLILALIPFVLIYSLRAIINDIRFYNGRYRWPMLKYQSTNTDVLSYLRILLNFIKIMLIIRILFNGIPTIAFISVLAIGGLFILFKLIRELNVSKNIQCALSILAVCIITAITVFEASHSNFLTNKNSDNLEEVTNLDYFKEKNCRVSVREESVFLKYMALTCENDEKIDFYQGKTQFLSDLINRKYLEMNFMESQTIPFDNQIERNLNYVYRGKDFGVFSNKEIPQELIDEVKQ